MASFEKRGESVRVVVRIPGGRKLTGTFSTEQEARAWAKEQERKKFLGTLRGAAAGGHLNSDLWDTYQEMVGSKTDSARTNGLRIAKWGLDPLASLAVDATTTHDINEWIARRAGEVSGSSVNRELNLMSAAFTYAVKDLAWISSNPCHGARRRPPGRPRHRALLSSKEIEAVEIATGMRQGLQTKTARTGAAFLLSLETGMRSGEILRIKPEHYSRNALTVRVAAEEKGGRKGSKSGQIDASRLVPLTPRAVELLDALLATKPADQPYIVGMSDKQRDTLFRKARKRSGVEDLTFHHAKHEAATRLAPYLDVIELSHAIGTKNLKLLRDTYYVTDASRSAAKLPRQLAP